MKKLTLGITTITLPLAMACALCPTAVAEDLMRTQHFDRDPKWDALHNRVPMETPHRVRQFFGWSRTRNAEGERTGEIGGRVQRSLTRARYSTTLTTPLTLEDRIEFSGRLAVTKDDGNSGVLLGLFNERSDGWRTPNALAIRIDGNGGKYWLFADYGSRNGLVGGLGAFEGERYQTTPTKPFAANGTSHRWSLRYDPNAADHGELTLKIDDRVYRTVISREVRADGAVFDRFGIWNQQATGSGMEVWFDDLVVNGQHFGFDGDPRWTGEGNDADFADGFVRPFHQYGFSETGFAGGRRGELGGVIWRDERPSYYADRIEQMSLENELRASGKLAFLRAGADSGVYLGWFNARTKAELDRKRESGQREYLGVLIEGPSRIGHYFRPGYATQSGTGRNQDVGPVLRPSEQVLAWSIHYRPRAANGRGEIRATIDGESSTLILAPGDRERGAVFDRFGLFNIQAGGWHVELYLDDLSYTAGASSSGKN